MVSEHVVSESFRNVGDESSQLNGGLRSNRVVYGHTKALPWEPYVFKFALQPSGDHEFDAQIALQLLLSKLAIQKRKQCTLFFNGREWTLRRRRETVNLDPAVVSEANVSSAERAGSYSLTLDPTGLSVPASTLTMHSSVFSQGKHHPWHRPHPSWGQLQGEASRLPQAAHLRPSSGHR